MPSPKPREDLKSFVTRYMASNHARQKFPDRKQRYAVARSEHKRKQ